MKSIRGIFGIFSVIVCGMTLWFIVAQEPEVREVKSADGVVTVTGRMRIDDDFAITPDTDAATATPLISHVYHVTSTGAQNTAPVVLTFERSRTAGTADATTVYRFNASLGMWEQVNDVVANTKNVLAVRVSTLGNFALGTAPDVAAPTMLTAFDALREKAPQGTRGYGFAVAYTLPGGVPIRLADQHEYGGCGGRMGAGDRYEYSSVATPLSVLVNDVSTPVVFTVAGEWIVAADGIGCSSSSALEARDESLLYSVSE